MSYDRALFDAFHEQSLPRESDPEEKALFTSVIDEEYSDLCPKTGVPFFLTVLSPQPP
jgi:hypothetical protein